MDPEPGVDRRALDLSRVLRTIGAVLLFTCIALSVAACRLGGAHADLLLNIKNDSAQSTTVRWASTGLFGANGVAFLEPGAETVDGLVADTYTFSVDGGPSTLKLVVVPATGDPTSTVVVGKDLSLSMP
jgi:hypothetical protein